LDIEVRYSVDFDAGHKAETRERCRRQHGHHWQITVAARSRKGEAEDADMLRESIHQIIAEWADRDLNEMIANFAETTPERLAPWVMERLMLGHPLLTLVEVSDGVITASVRREPPYR
jgi:6-pyruvoyl-tetrahydropterin synthase